MFIMFSFLNIRDPVKICHACGCTVTLIISTLFLLENFSFIPICSSFIELILCILSFFLLFLFKMRYIYDEQGVTFNYFLLTFIAIFLIPTTFSLFLNKNKGWFFFVKSLF